MSDFIMPVLVDVLSARRAERGRLDLTIVVTNHQGNPEPETIPYTWDPEEKVLPDGRFYALGDEISAWFDAHPDVEIAEYIPPRALTPVDKLAAAGLTLEDLKALLKE